MKKSAADEEEGKSRVPTSRKKNLSSLKEKRIHDQQGEAAQRKKRVAQLREEEREKFDWSLEKKKALGLIKKKLSNPVIEDFLACSKKVA